MRRPLGQGHGEENSPQPRLWYYVLAETTRKHFKLTSMASPWSRPYTINTLVLSSPAFSRGPDTSNRWSPQPSERLVTFCTCYQTCHRRLPSKCSWPRSCKTLNGIRPVWSAKISAEESIAQASECKQVLLDKFSRQNGPPPNLICLSSRRLEWPALWWRHAVLSVCLLYDNLKTGKHPIKECVNPLVSEKSQCSFRKPINLLLPVARTTRTQQSFFFIPPFGTHCHAKHDSTITDEAIIQENRQISRGWTEISSERSHMH